jgi:signal transduction histidine kinase
MALEQMIEGFAHDAQNLIFAGRLATSGLAEEIGASRGSREKVEVLSQVFEEAERVVKRLMGWSAVSSSEGPLELNTFLRELAPFLGYLAPKPIQVKVACADKPLWAFLDSTALSHALFNMIANAREAMLLAQQTAGVILVELGEGAGQGEVVLRIKDDGPGVPIAQRQRIFRPYVSTKEGGEGHGLGLALARLFAEKSGGTLELEATAEGASFAFTFPVCEPREGGG